MNAREEARLERLQPATNEEWRDMDEFSAGGFRPTEDAVQARLDDEFGLRAQLVMLLEMANPRLITTGLSNVYAEAEMLGIDMSVFDSIIDEIVKHAENLEVKMAEKEALRNLNPRQAAEAANVEIFAFVPGDASKAGSKPKICMRGLVGAQYPKKIWKSVEASVQAGNYTVAEIHGQRSLVVGGYDA